MTHQLQIIRDNTSQLKNNMYGHHIGYDLTEEEYKYLIEQATKALRYEKIIHSIANIDAMFISAEGEEREWNDKEALDQIKELVMPVWNEHCREPWRELDELISKDKI